ncbi:MAG: phage capsid protein [Sphingomonas sp.]|nr:phage capsid protein [Sphingomonas sp.]
MPQAPFVTSSTLTAIALDYGTVNSKGRGFLADEVLPRVRVDAPEFRYASYPLEEAFEVLDTQAGRRSKLNEMLLTATEAAGFVRDYGLEAPIPFRDEQAARSSAMPFPIRARNTRALVDKVQLARELRASSLVFGAGNYQTGYKATLAGATQWSDAASDPVAAILDAKASMLMSPNVLVVGEPVFRAMQRHSKISTALGGSGQSGRYVPANEMAGVLGFDRIIVGNTISQTSKKGQALTTAPIWGKHAALLRVAPTNGVGTVDNPEEPSFGYTFQWGDQVAGEYNDPQMGLLGGVRIKYGEMIDERVVAPYAGYLFSNAVA